MNDSPASNHRRSYNEQMTEIRRMMDDTLERLQVAQVDMFRRWRGVLAGTHETDYEPKKEEDLSEKIIESTESIFSRDQEFLENAIRQSEATLSIATQHANGLIEATRGQAKELAHSNIIDVSAQVNVVEDPVEQN